MTDRDGAGQSHDREIHLREAPKQRRLNKELKLLDVYAIATGTTLSAGFFLLPGIAAAQELAARIRAAEDVRADLEAERAAQSAEVDRAAEVVDEAEARTQARLDGDPAYQGQRERAREARARVDPALRRMRIPRETVVHGRETVHEDWLTVV